MKKLEINIPEGMEIDWQESAKQEKIVFKEKQLTYEDVCEKLFNDGYCYIDMCGRTRADGHNTRCIYEPNNAKTRHQLECILAKNKLANVAVYLNNGWEPNLNSEYGCCFALNGYHDLIIEHCAVLCGYSLGKIMFKSRKLAQQAIEILGEETIKLALEPLY